MKDPGYVPALAAARATPRRRRRAAAHGSRHRDARARPRGGRAPGAGAVRRGRTRHVRQVRGPSAARAPRPSLAAHAAARRRPRRARIPGDGQAAPGFGRALHPPSRATPATPASSSITSTEPVMVQRAMHGPELSIDCLGDADGRCLNAIPRTMLESRGGESIKGTVVADRELDRARPRRRWRRSRCAGPRRSRSSATPTSGWGSPTSTRASAAPSRGPCTPRGRAAATPS